MPITIENLLVLSGGAMPAIGLATRYSLSTSTPSIPFDSGYVTVVSITGSGRLRSIQHSYGFTSGGSGGFLRITIDGVLLLDDTYSSGTSYTKDVSPRYAGSALSFEGITGSGTSRVYLDTYFKSSILVQHRISHGGGGFSGDSVSTVVEIEKS